MKIERVELSEITPYENNPRINDIAITEVKKSIRQVGYVTPIILDEKYVILAGHTRYEALLEMGEESVECVVLDTLTDTQKRKYRLLDNKTGELAQWDENLLKGEIDGLDMDDIYWFDNLSSPDVEELSGGADTSEKKEKKDTEGAVVKCPRCGAIVEEYGDE